MTKRLNTEDFIKKAKVVHGNKYDYSSVLYIKSNLKVQIACSKHGIFHQSPSKHLFGRGCVKCGIKSSSDKRKLGKKRFIEKAVKIHGDFFDYSEVVYRDAKKNINIICPEHGIFKTKPTNHLNSIHGCLKCGIKQNADNRTITKKVFIQKAEKVHGKKYNYEETKIIDSTSNINIICSIHGEFSQRLNLHLKGAGCQKCSGVIPSNKNNLQVLFPEIIKEFHPTKNKGLKPNELLPYSNKKIWWLCPKGHEYEAIIANRTNDKSSTSCPYCSGNRLGYGNDLETVYPFHAEHWHPTKNGNLKPSQVMPRGSKMVWWLCPNGHDFKTRIATKTNAYPGSTGCPNCTSQNSYPQLLIYSEMKYLFNTVNNRFIEFGKEIDVFIKGINLGIEYDGFYWHKDRHAEDIEKYNHNISIGLKQINIRSEGLKTISINDIVVKKNHKDLELILPLVSKIMEICDLTKKEQVKLKKYLNDKVLKNEDYFKKLLLSLPKPLPGESFEARFPEIAKEFHPTKNGDEKPSDFHPFTHRKKWWICEKNHEWKAQVLNRTNMGSGCPYCSNKAAGYGNDLQTNYPKIAATWNKYKNKGIEPSKVVPGSHKSVWWKCEDGHEYERKIYDQVKFKTCPYCSGTRLTAEKIAAMKDMLINGYARIEIAKKIGVARHTVSRYAKKWGL